MNGPDTTCICTHWFEEHAGRHFACSSPGCDCPGFEYDDEGSTPEAIADRGGDPELWPQWVKDYWAAEDAPFVIANLPLRTIAALIFACVVLTVTTILTIERQVEPLVSAFLLFGAGTLSLSGLGFLKRMKDYPRGGDRHGA